MRQSTFDALDTFPILLEPPMAATLACHRLRLGELIAQAQATFQEETGKTLTVAQAVALIDQESTFAQEEHYWEGEPLRTVTLRGINARGYRETTKLVITFNGDTFALTEYRDGVDFDGYDLAHSLAEVNDQLEMSADAVRTLYRMRKEAGATARPRKARRPSKRAPQPELTAASA